MAERREIVPFEIPFYHQFVSAENYRSEGYETLEEGLFWAERSCGIASVRMVIDALRRQRGQPNCPNQATVLRYGVSLGAYQPGVGWIHSGLLRIASQYGVYGERYHGAGVEEVHREIAAGHPCIVSVTPRFAGGTVRADGSAMPKSGHLIVAYGAFTERGKLTGFLVHHPSCFLEAAWPQCRVAIERFCASFSGNYLSFDPDRRN